MPSSTHLLDTLVTALIPMIVSLSLHEWGHAAVATALGDPTPREQGRLTLNPVAHMDFFGTFLLPGLLATAGLPVFGWARPVQFVPHRFTRKVSMTTGIMLTAAAGPAMNLLIAVVAAIFLASSDWHARPYPVPTLNLLSRIEVMNVTLFVFNLLPVPPLDGSRVVAGLLPSSVRMMYVGLERYSGLFLGVLMLWGGAVIFAPTMALADALDQMAHVVFR